MIYYLSNVIYSAKAIRERDPDPGGAGCHRTLYIAGSVQEQVLIISMGGGKRKGFHPVRIDRISANVAIRYLPEFNFTLFGKKLRHFSYSFFLFVYLFRNVKRDDKIIVYNTENAFFMILPLLLVKLFRNCKYVLELEELYSYARTKRGLGLVEKVSIKYASGCLAVSEIQAKFFGHNKPYLLTGGYKTGGKRRAGDFVTRYPSPVVVYTGRLDGYSGVDVLLASIRHISKVCVVCCTGRGQFEEELNGFKNENPNVDFCFLGSLGEKEFADLLLEAKIGISPLKTSSSFSDVSFPSKISQYLENGLIVVSSEIPALKQLAGLREYIFSYKGDSPVELARAIDKAIELNYDKLEAKGRAEKYLSDQQRRIGEFVESVFTG
jgi:glycosyltransferase involved in cell wall biosynthesis